MSKVAKLLAGLVVAAGVAVAVPQAAMAQHWHGGGGHWHGGGGHWHGGWHGGHHWRGGGWGWGPGFALGFGLGAAPYYASPYYYGGDCGWVRTRYWRHGFWHVRRVWRCW